MACLTMSNIWFLSRSWSARCLTIVLINFLYTQHSLQSSVSASFVFLLHFNFSHFHSFTLELIEFLISSSSLSLQLQTRAVLIGRSNRRLPASQRLWESRRWWRRGRRRWWRIYRWSRLAWLIRGDRTSATEENWQIHKGWVSMLVAAIHNRRDGLSRFHHFVRYEMQYGNGKAGARGACE